MRRRLPDAAMALAESDKPIYLGAVYHDPTAPTYGDLMDGVASRATAVNGDPPPVEDVLQDFVG